MERCRSNPPFGRGLDRATGQMAVQPVAPAVLIALGPLLTP